MTSARLYRASTAFTALVLASGCPDGGTAAGDDTGSSGGASSSSTGAPPPPAETDATGAVATSEPATSSSTSTGPAPATGSSGDPGSSTGSGGSSSGGSGAGTDGGSSDSGSGSSSGGIGVMPVGYGDCANAADADACAIDETCLVAPGFAFCSGNACVVPGDCPMPDTGDAIVSCAQLTPDPPSNCFLDCSGGQTCPDGMICAPGFGVCAWEPIPDLCPNEMLDASMFPIQVSGHSFGYGDTLTPSCAAGGDDVTFEFTAPADATYVFDTAGSNFDTVLAILDGGCMGLELACNDDAMVGILSEITLPMTMGQTVLVVVDGAAGATGFYALTVTQL